MNVLLLKALQTPIHSVDHYRGEQRACTGLGKLYEGVSLLDDRIHSNTAAISTDMLGRHTATINHHLSADLQATSDSLRGPPDATVLNSCLILFIVPLLARVLGFCLCFSQSTTLLLYLLLTRLSQVAVWEAISSELVRRLILF